MFEQLDMDYTFQSFLIPKFFKNEMIQQFYQVHQLTKQNIKSKQIYCEMIQSENTLEIYEGLVGLRTILYGEQVYLAPQKIELAVSELNILKYIIHIIEHNEFQLIICEALQILSNLTVCSSQIIDQIIQNGSINCLIIKFSKGNYHELIIELVCLIFDNVRADSIYYRDRMLKLGTLKILNNYAIDRILQYENLHLIDQLSWLIRNYFQFKSTPPLKDLLITFKIFKQWIQQDFPLHTFSRICWCFSEFVKSHPSQIQVIIDLGIMPRIIELVEVNNDWEMFSANIQLLNNILKSDQNNQEYLQRIGIIPCLGRLIQKYQESPNFLKKILKAFTVISFSKHLSLFLLNSNELDLLLSLLNKTYLYDQIHNIIENLINLHQYNESISQIQNNKIIILCRLFVSRNFNEKKQELYEIVLNLCDTYLKDERYSQFYEELQKIKSQLIQKLKQYYE